jgi:translation initiation factor IF-2
MPGYGWPYPTFPGMMPMGGFGYPGYGPGPGPYPAGMYPPQGGHMMRPYGGAGQQQGAPQPQQQAAAALPQQQPQQQQAPPPAAAAVTAAPSPLGPQGGPRGGGRGGGGGGGRAIPADAAGRTRGGGPQLPREQSLPGAVSLPSQASWSVPPPQGVE